MYIFITLSSYCFLPKQTVCTICVCVCTSCKDHISIYKHIARMWFNYRVHKTQLMAMSGVTSFLPLCGSISLREIGRLCQARHTALGI